MARGDCVPTRVPHHEGSAAVWGWAQGRSRRIECAYFLSGAVRHPTRLIMSTMDPEKIAAMRNRESLQHQMQVHYRSGNMKEARRIEAMLAPEEDEETQKYLHKSGTAEKAYISSRNAD